MKKKIYDAISLAIMACIVGLMFSSCDNSVINIEITQDDNGGNFTVINMGTNDTLKINGGLTIGSNPTLDVHNGNIIKIKFEQKEEYKDYVFNTTYTLPNDEVVENQPEIEYVVGDNLNGSYYIKMSASSIGETKNKSWTITAGNTFTLKVVQ